MKAYPAVAAGVFGAALTASAVLAAPATAAPSGTSEAATTTVKADAADTGRPAAGGIDVVGVAAYNGACGAGYSVIDSMPVGNSGRVYLTWSGSTGKNCVVTVRNTPGSPVNMVASIDLLPFGTGPGAEDAGKYTTYAGPVYLDASGVCVRWSGSIGSATATADGHCG